MRKHYGNKCNKAGRERGFREELPKILKDVMLNLIPEEEPEEDEKRFVDEEIKAEDYIPLEKVLNKYE